MQTFFTSAVIALGLSESVRLIALKSHTTDPFYTVGLFASAMRRFRLTEKRSCYILQK